MKPRLLLFDLDGTLLSPTREIHPENIRALRDAMQREIRVGFATGRTRRSVQPYVDALQPNGPLILMNGCALWDMQRDEAVAARQLAVDDAVSALVVLTELGIHANVYVGRDLFVAHRGELSVQSEIKDGVPHTEVGDIVSFVRDAGHTPFKLLCIEPDGNFGALRDGVTQRLADRCTLVRSEPTYLEILPANVNKGAMLPAIEQHYGISSAEVIAFGDQLNDLELLRASGTGVAMGNAHADATAAADVSIADNTGDAIARFVRDLF